MSEFSLTTINILALSKIILLAYLFFIFLTILDTAKNYLSKVLLNVYGFLPAHGYLAATPRAGSTRRRDTQISCPGYRFRGCSFGELPGMRHFVGYLTHLVE